MIYGVEINIPFSLAGQRNGDVAYDAHEQAWTELVRQAFRGTGKAMRSAHLVSGEKSQLSGYHSRWRFEFEVDHELE